MRHWYLIIFAVVVMTSLGQTARGETGIILEDADAQWVTTTTLNGAVSQSLAGVPNHIIVDTAPGLTRVTLTQVVPELQSKFSALGAQILLDQANSNQTVFLTPPATELGDSLSAILRGLIIDQANSNHEVKLAYPFDLINDQSPPTLQGPVVMRDGPIYRITWQTNEFTRFVLRYGTSPGNYSATLTETLYYRQHLVELTTLQEGQTYYFVIESEDLSGNKATTNEQRLEVRQQVFQFLPVLQR